MAVILRPANLETDPERVAGLINQVDSKPVTAEEVLAWFAFCPEGRITRRMIAGENGQILGYCAVVRENYYPPGDFYVWTAVDPSRRRQGIGAALYEDAQEFLRSQKAARLRSEVREYCAAGRRFAGQRGFIEDRLEYESVLDLYEFNETPYLPLLERLEAEGVRFFCMADGPDGDDWLRRLYEVNRATGLDIPGVQEFPDFSGFKAMIDRGDWYQPEGQLLAAVGECWVGLAAVQWMPASGEAYNLMTGVLRAYRGRGIALALKIWAIRYARRQGARVLRTNNDSANLAMIAINRRLGYQPEEGKYMLAGKME